MCQILYRLDTLIVKRNYRYLTQSRYMVGLYISFQFGLRVPTTSIYTACRHYRSLLQLVDMFGLLPFQTASNLSSVHAHFLRVIDTARKPFFNGSVISTILSILL